VKAYARGGVVFSKSLYCRFTRESSSEKNENQLSFDRIVAVSLWPHFLAHPVDK